MSYITKNISRYIKNKGFNLSKISRETDIPYSALQASLYSNERNRSLRDDELVKLCIFLNVDPRQFADKDELESGAQKRR